MTSPSLLLWGLVAPVAQPAPGALLTPASSASAASAVAVSTGSTAEPSEVVRTPPPELVTPGTLGFLVTFVVAVALVLLVRDMVRRNRGLVVRAERRDAELRDAQLRDAGPREAGAPGSGPRDAEPRDAEPRDAGAPGAGTQGTEPRDARPRDVGPRQRRPGDAGGPPQV